MTQRACPTCGGPLPRGVCRRCGVPMRNRSAAARGYGKEFQQARRLWKARVATGTVRCARGRGCLYAATVAGVLTGGIIRPGEPWDLGHSDDRTQIVGPEHSVCNRGAPNRTAA